MKPRIVENILPQAIRFPSASTLGTGSSTQTTENGGINGILECSAGSAGRSWNTFSYTLAAGQWYCFSFEVTAATSLVADCGIALTFGAVTPDNGDTGITGTEIAAGGVGRYALVFMSSAGGSMTQRLGVGLNANAADSVLTFKNIMLEAIDINSGGFPSEYQYSQFKSAFNYPNQAAISSNNLVTASSGNTYSVEKGQVLLALGDSRNDEIDDIGGAISNALGRTGVCFIHAEGGWTTTNLVGPTTKKSTFSCTSSKAINGTLLTRTFSSDGTEEMYDILSGQLEPDVVIITCAGVNDIVAGAANDLTVDTALTNVQSMIDEIVAAGKTPCITEVTPWNASASFSETDGDQIQTWVYNKRLKELAEANDAIFVPLYAAFGDSTDEDKLSDGLGSTPDYDDGDGLHVNPEGCRVAAGLILSAIEIWKQKNNLRASK